MEMNPSIFKAYDIRGVYPDEINEEAAYNIGRAFAKYSKADSIMVGRDTRLSSPALNNSLINGITSQGVNVVDIGLCSTSCFYYSLAESGLGGGVMTTASHNSKEFNGFKPMFKDAAPLTKEQILELKKMVTEEQFEVKADVGKVSQKKMTDNYTKMVRNSISATLKPLKIVMDAGNGMAGLYIEKVFSGLGISVIPIYTDLDGDFPNHETNPKIPENRKKLADKIISDKADLGFMFDGDADRVCVLDRRGRLIDYSLVLALISEYLVKNSSKKKVIVEVRTSRIVQDWVEKAGGEIIVSSCWTIPIKLAMKSNPEVIFGGETSGHYMFRDTHESDDGIFGALTFMQAISSKADSIDEIIDKFENKYFVLEETNFKIASKEKAQNILKRLEDIYLDRGGKIIKIDGLSVVFPGWWFNLRQSNVDPVIRLNMEADSKTLFEEKKAEIINLIKE